MIHPLARNDGSSVLSRGKIGWCRCSDYSQRAAYVQFVRLLKSSSEFKEVPVLAPYSNVGLTENWYQCLQCEQVWRLVSPDPPFAGLWEPVA